MGLIILNYDPELSLAQPEEKQSISCGVQERLKLLRENIYIFKYTSSAPNLKVRGFMIGVAGGYDTDVISDNETGHTFSDFKPIGDNYKEQALGIIRMISDYWKRAAGQAQ